MSASPGTFTRQLRKLIAPLLVSTALGLVLYFGGTTFQAIGFSTLSDMQEVIARVLGVLVVFALAVFIRRFVSVIFDGLLSRTGSAVPKLLSQLVSVIIYITAIAVVASAVFHRDLSVLLTGVGIIGFVLGTALKDLIADTAFGLSINLDKSIKIGDFIQIHRGGDGTIEGRVVEISWRATILQDRNNNSLMLPNSQMGRATVTNFSMPDPFIKIAVSLIIDADVPAERVFRILSAATVEALVHPDLDKSPPPKVHATRFHDATMRSAPGTAYANGKGLEYTIDAFTTWPRRTSDRSAILASAARHMRIAGLIAVAVEPQNATGYAAQTGLVLGRTDFFRELDAPLLGWIGGRSTVRTLEPGAELVHAGTVATAMFVVVEGLLVAEQSRRKLEAPRAPMILGPGTVIGGFAMLAGDVYPANVRARTAVSVCEIDLGLIRGVIERAPDALVWISRAAAQEFLEAEKARTGGQSQVSREEVVADLSSALRRNLGPGVGN